MWYLIRRRTFESGEVEDNGNFIERTVSVECLKPDTTAFVSEGVARQWKLCMTRMMPKPIPCMIAWSSLLSRIMRLFLVGML